MKTSGKIELVICLGALAFPGNRETLEALKAYLKENREDRVMFKGQHVLVRAISLLFGLTESSTRPLLLRVPLES